MLDARRGVGVTSRLLVVGRRTSSSVYELWSVDISSPANTSGIYGKIGDLPSGWAISGLVWTGSVLYGFGSVNSTNSLKVINPDTGGSGSGGGSLESNIVSPEGAAYDGSNLYMCDNRLGVNSRLYKINPDDPDSSSGGYGDQGVFPSGLSIPSAMCWAGGKLICYNSGPQFADLGIWNINPSDPDSISGDYGHLQNYTSSMDGIAYTGNKLIAITSVGSLFELGISSNSITSLGSMHSTKPETIFGATWME